MSAANPAPLTEEQKEAVLSFKNACEAGDIGEARRIFPQTSGKINLSEVFSIVAKKDDHFFLKTLIEEFNLDKNEALRQVVVKDRLPMVEYLLKQGVDPRFDGARDIKIAAFNGYMDVFRMMLDSVPCDTPTLYNITLRAAENHQRAVLDEMLDKRFDLHWDNEKLLRDMCAHNRPQPDSLAYVLGRGADVHALGERPLAEAVEHSRFRNIPVLLNYGADPMLLAEDAYKKAKDLPQSVVAQMDAAEEERMVEASEIVAGMNMPADLKTKFEPQKMSGVMLVIRAGELKSFVYKVTTEQPLWAKKISADLLTEKNGALSPLDLAVRTNQHKSLFTPALWLNRENEMKKLWDHLPAETKESMPWADTVRELQAYHAAMSNHEKLMSRSMGIPRLRR